MDVQNPPDEDPSIVELRKERGSRFVKDRDPSRLLEFPRTATKWRLDPIFYEREDIPEPSAVCVATQAEGPSIGLKAIVKMRMDDVKYKHPPPDKKIDGLDPMPWAFCEEAEIELQALKRLTDLGCKATPKLLDYKVELQTESDMVEGAHALYVLMEKVPGRNLLNFGELSMAERNEARIGFSVALRELCSHGYHHDDPHPRNVMWDAESKKCHIIDLEQALDCDYLQQPACVGDFYDWLLHGPDGWRGRQVDPMVACMEYGRAMPDEEELRRIANVTMEKGLGVTERIRPGKGKKPLEI